MNPLHQPRQLVQAGLAGGAKLWHTILMLMNDRHEFSVIAEREAEGGHV